MSEHNSSRNALVATTVAGAVALGTYIAYELRRRGILAAQRAELIESTLVADHAEVQSQKKEASDVALNLEDVSARLRAASAAAGRASQPPCLVAVSKTKPIEMLRDAYKAGQRHFGENYVQEIVSKVDELPDDVKWHFIGGLQSNKAKELVKGCGAKLHVVETVESAKLADKLNAAVEGLTPPRPDALGVMIQVNTSPWEGSKGGVLAADVPSLATHIRTACPRLHLVGLMTIGAAGDLSCFDALRECRDRLAAQLGMEPSALVLSMGMSGDFEAAIAKGSDSVRVGSSIFGARDYSARKS